MALPLHIPCAASSLNHKIHFFYVLFPQRIICLKLQKRATIGLLIHYFKNCIKTIKNRFKRTLSPIHKLCSPFSVLKVCFTIFQGVSKVRNTNNMFSLNIVGRVFDEYIKISVQLKFHLYGCGFLHLALTFVYPNTFHKIVFPN